LGKAVTSWPEVSKSIITDHDYQILFTCGFLRLLLFYPYLIMSNFFTKLTSVMGAATLVAVSTGASLVAAASEFLPYAEVLADNGVINAQSTEAGYRLGANVTRAEIAKVVANLGGIDPVACSGTVYSDVGSGLGDLCGYVEALADAGVVSTSSATFRPNANVTRAEMVKMILGALGETGSDVDAGYMDVAGLGDLTSYVNRANEIGCVGDASYFRPNAASSRGEAFKVAVICAGLEPDVTVEPPTGGTGVVVPPTTVSGSVTASLEGQAMAQYVPKNASSVKVGTVKLMAGSSDVTVRSLQVTRSGLGNASDIIVNGGVRAAQNGVVISSSSDFYNSTSQVGNVYFYPSLMIKAGTSQMVDILVSLSGAENSQHQFALTAVNADNSAVSGTPVTLGLLNTTSYVTASVTVGGTYTYAATPGKTSQTIAKVDLTAGSRDVNVNGFTLTRSGSNDLTKKFANVMVYKNGTKVGNAMVSSDKIYVTGLATPLAAGNFQAFELKADVLVDGSSSSNVLQLKVESSTDVSATEVATGYATQTTGAATLLGTVTFSNVDVTYTKQSTANQTVSPGTSNVTLFDAKLTSTVPLSVRQLTITPAVGAVSGALAFANDQLSVKVNGAEVATITASDFPAGSVAPIVKTVSIPVDSSTAARITIVGSSVKNVTPASTYTFGVKLGDVRDAANNTVALLTDTVTGDKTTIQAPTLTVKPATVAAPTNDKISAVSNQEAGRFGFTAEGDSVRVTKLVMTNIGTALLSDIVDASSIELRDAATDTKISGTVSLVGNVVTVDSMSNDIAKDVTQNVKVVFTTVKSLDSNYGNTIQLRVVSPTDVTASNVNGGSTVALPAATVNGKLYTIGVVPPNVLVTANTPLTQNAKIATIKVTNVDSNTGITVQNIVTTFQSRSTANGTFTFAGQICLRDLGSTASCGGSGTTAAQAVTQAGGAFTFVVAGSNLSNEATSLTKNNGYTEYEVYVDGAPLWVAGDNANVTVTSVVYNAPTANTQSYVGVAGASATATK
jgi:hypothetical protein